MKSAEEGGWMDSGPLVLAQKHQAVQLALL